MTDRANNSFDLYQKYMDAYTELIKLINRPQAPTNEITVNNVKPVSQTSFYIDSLMTACIMANGTLLNDIWELKTGRRQKVTIDYVHAALSYLSFLMVTQNRLPIAFPDSHRIWPYYPIMNAYKTRDDRHVYITGVYPHIRDGLLDLLNAPNNALAIGTSIAQWDAEDLEYQINKRGLSGGMIRTSKEWRNHPQGKVLTKLPPILIEKMGNTSQVPFKEGAQPLTGIKVIDFTHLLAAPLATRILAEQGAEVLHLSGPKVGELLPFCIDTGHGKRNASINLNVEADRNIVIELIKQADVFVQSYTPGRFQKLGFGPEDIHRINPNAIYVNVSCFGTTGPWSGFKGFEQIAQAVSGIMAAHSSLDKPTLFPAAVCDYLAGNLCSLGILKALHNRATEGGSYNVDVSLVRTAMFVDSHGHRAGKDTTGSFPDDFEPYLMVSKSAYGDIKHLKPVLEMSETKAHWRVPLSPLGSSYPKWIGE